MKSLKLGDVVLADGHKSKVTKITDDGVVGLVLDEGLWTETFYGCSIHDISLDNDGDWVLNKKFVPVVGDVIKVNEKEYKLVDIEENVVTLKRNDEIRYYSFYDIEHDIIDDYWISSMCEQVRSPSVKRKLEVYEVQKGVYEYKSLCELREIYTLLGQPTLYNLYGLKYNDYNTFIDSLQSNFGLLVFWTEFDTEYGYEYKYIKIIDGAIIEERKCNESKI